MHTSRIKKEKNRVLCVCNSEVLVEKSSETSKVPLVLQDHAVEEKIRKLFLEI